MNIVIEGLQVLLWVVGGLGVLLTLLPFIPADVWWIRVWDFPRAQIAVALFIALILYPTRVLTQGDILDMADLAFLVVLLFCLVYQLARIFPYTRMARNQVQDSRNPQMATQIRLLFVNVEMENRHATKLKRTIREADPDVILAAETDDWWVQELAEFKADYPHTVWQPQNNYYGMMLFSRLELVNPKLQFLVQDDIPSIHTGVRLRGGKVVQLYCLHPRPPVPNDLNKRSTERDAELLLVGRKIGDHPGPDIVLGDLNDVAWSHTTHLFERISGLLDPRIGRCFYNSFNARHWFIRFPLDHVYHSNHFRLVDFKRLDAFGSDHFPMCVTLNYEPDATLEQAAEEATPEDEMEAVEKIEKVAE